MRNLRDRGGFGYFLFIEVLSSFVKEGKIAEDLEKEEGGNEKGYVGK